MRGGADSRAGQVSWPAGEAGGRAIGAPGPGWHLAGPGWHLAGPGSHLAGPGPHVAGPGRADSRAGQVSWPAGEAGRRAIGAPGPDRHLAGPGWHLAGPGPQVTGPGRADSRAGQAGWPAGEAGGRAIGDPGPDRYLAGPGPQVTGPGRADSRAGQVSWPAGEAGRRAIGAPGPGWHLAGPGLHVAGPGSDLTGLVAHLTGPDPHPTDPVAVLVGPMGVGKSTVGRLLAVRLGTGFRDTDGDIVTAEGRTIAEIFAVDGEPAFRAAEKRAVVRALNGHGGVLALGGGAVLDPGTRALLAGRRVLYLTMGAAEAARRLDLGAGRPLLAANPLDKWRELMAARRHLYEEVATAIVATDRRTPDEVTEAALDALELKTATTPFRGAPLDQTPLAHRR
ncbi:shikimate kinase [Streptomyces acidiscabies]|nr:shikimate kinase [Streptomyces acidiscabies]